MFKTGRHYILLFYETSRHQPKSKDPNIEKLLQHIERTFRCFSSSETFGKLEVPTSNILQKPWKTNPLDLQKMHKKAPALPNNKLLGESVLQDELDGNNQRAANKKTGRSTAACHPISHVTIQFIETFMETACNCCEKIFDKVGFLEVLPDQTPPIPGLLPASPKHTDIVSLLCHYLRPKGSTFGIISCNIG